MIITRPIITEKSLFLAQKGWYTFRVEASARKEALIPAFKALFNVDVVDIRTVRMEGKSRRAGKKLMRIRKPDWKKAMIRLKDGQTIDAFKATSTETPAKDK